MMLPDQVGTQVVKSLRERQSTLPIIAISGMMGSGDFDELLRLKPAVECLAKPLTPSVLLGAVRRGLPVKVAG
jgi:CheY-like chemotaxis protein